MVRNLLGGVLRPLEPIDFFESLASICTLPKIQKSSISNRSIKTGGSEKPPKYKKSDFSVFGPRLCRKFRAFIWRKSGVDPRSLRGVRAIFVNLVFFSPVVFLVVWKTWVAKIVHYLETHSPRLGKCKKMGQLGDPIKQKGHGRFFFPLCT